MHDILPELPRNMGDYMIKRIPGVVTEALRLIKISKKRELNDSEKKTYNKLLGVLDSQWSQKKKTETPKKEIEKPKVVEDTPPPEIEENAYSEVESNLDGLSEKEKRIFHFQEVKRRNLVLTIKSKLLERVICVIPNDSFRKDVPKDKNVETVYTADEIIFTLENDLDIKKIDLVKKELDGEVLHPKSHFF